MPSSLKTYAVPGRRILQINYLGHNMKILTDPQVSEIKRLLIELERKSNPHTIAYAEKVLAIILQAEQITFKLEC